MLGHVVAFLAGGATTYFLSDTVKNNVAQIKNDVQQIEQSEAKIRQKFSELAAAYQKQGRLNEFLAEIQNQKNNMQISC